MILIDEVTPFGSLEDFKSFWQAIARMTPEERAEPIVQSAIEGTKNSWAFSNMSPQERREHISRMIAQLRG